MSEPERSLLRRLRDRDERAFRELVEDHRDRVYNITFRMLGNKAEAEDVAQEVFISVFKSIDDFRNESKFSTWLYRIAVNAALVQVRKRRHREVPWPEHTHGDQPEPIETADEAPNPERQAVSADIRREIEAELARMTPIERAAFVLRHQEGRSLEEISAALSLNISAAKQAIFRAVRKLRAALEAPGEPA